MPKATKRISKPKKAKKPTSVNWGNLRAKKKAAPRRVWKHEGEPIEDVKQVPKGWTANEHDLDESDIDGQIERCHVRIKEGIMPSLFERRLQIYTESKERRNKMIESEPEGLSWEVYQRLDCLKSMKQDFEEKGDPKKQLPNVEGLMEAYRSGKLTWTQGLITYWSNGTQLCEPKVFDGDECEKIGRAHGKNFWVEGLHGPGPALLLGYFRFTEEACNPQYQHMFNFALRVPGGNGGHQEYQFMDDTGATTALIFEADLDQIQDTSGCDATSLGPIYAKTANGAVSRETYRLEVNIITPDHEELLDTWVPIQVTVVPGSQQADSPPRLSGMWMRHMLYTATCPDNKGYLYISNSLGGLTSQMPTVNAKDALPPPDAKPDWVNSRTLPPLPDHVGPFPSPKTVLRKVLPSDSTPTVDNGGMLPPSPLPSKRKQPLDGAESVADIDGAEAADQAKGRWTLTLRGKKRPKQAKRS